MWRPTCWGSTASQVSEIFRQCLLSSNECLQACSKLSLWSSGSQTCNSINCICSTYAIPKFLIEYRSNPELTKSVQMVTDEICSDIDIVNADVLFGLLCLRARRELSFLSFWENQDIGVYLCTEWRFFLRGGSHGMDYSWSTNCIPCTANAITYFLRACPNNVQLQF